MIPITNVTNSPVVNDEFADLETTRVLFMAMDGVPEAEKYEMPFKAHGGMYMPHIPGLRQTRYMLYRGMFTVLPSFTPVADWDSMVTPEMKANLPRSFTQKIITEEGVKEKTIMGFLQSHITDDGQFTQKRSNHVVYHKRFPGRDVRKATQRNTPHGVGGVVEITALKGASDVEVRTAQLFFFPNWNDVVTGEASLPDTVASMTAHIKSRIAEITSLPTDLHTSYKSIGADMLRSCEEFQRHALNTIKSDGVIFEVAGKAGHAEVQNSPISESMLAQTQTRRKNDLLAGDDSAVNRLASLMEQKEISGNGNAEKILLLEERKQYTAEITAGLRERDFDEEVRLGMRKAVETPVSKPQPYYTPSVEEEEVEAEVQLANTDIRICGKPTANGECKRELKEGDIDSCWQHK